jgi:hypothetical protein
MYSTRANYILGFHGCDESVRDKVVNGDAKLIISQNSYDWIGHGYYFWESSPSRALEFAKDVKKRKRTIRNPSVLGAIICLGHCLDLLDENAIRRVKEAHTELKKIYKNRLPSNKSGGSPRDKLLRELDCAVIQLLHYTTDQKKLPQYDSVRAAFFEGEKLYPSAGFRNKNHIQVCVRNPNCIKGFFIPRDLDDKHRNV